MNKIPRQASRVFALYEKGVEDDRFIRVLTRNTYNSVDEIGMARQQRRMENDTPPADQRIVPATSTDELPLDASEGKLRAVIRDNNDLFPDK